MSVLRLTPERYAELQRRARRQAPGPAGASKYGNRPTDGYASAKEARRAAELAFEMKAGTIAALEEQVKFVLVPAQYDRGGRHLIEREVAYFADFVYLRDGAMVVEDVKSKATKTPEYVIKRKLLLQRYGVRIAEIE